jgi:hypothetical protein
VADGASATQITAPHNVSSTTTLRIHRNGWQLIPHPNGTTEAYRSDGSRLTEGERCPTSAMIFCMATSVSPRASSTTSAITTLVPPEW